MWLRLTDMGMLPLLLLHPSLRMLLLLLLLLRLHLPLLMQMLMLILQLLLDVEMLIQRQGLQQLLLL